MVVGWIGGGSDGRRTQIKPVVSSAELVQAWWLTRVRQE
jgi:hypothetical protein